MSVDSRLVASTSKRVRHASDDPLPEVVETRPRASNTAFRETEVSVAFRATEAFAARHLCDCATLSNGVLMPWV